MQTFSEIDARREVLGIAQKDLCERADVNASSYSRAKISGVEPTPRIRRKLTAALDAFMAEKRAALDAMEGAGQ